MKRLRSVAVAILPPLLFGVVFLTAWELLIEWREVKPYVMVKPSAVWSAMLDNFTPIRTAAGVTGGNALTGLLFGPVFVGVLATGASSVSIAPHPLSSSMGSSPNWKPTIQAAW